MSWGPSQPSQYDSGNPYGQQPHIPPQQPPQPFPGPQGQPLPGQQFPGPQFPDAQQQFTWPSALPQQPQPPQPFAADTGHARPRRGHGALIGLVVGALVLVGGGITAALLLTGEHHGTTAVTLTAPSAIKGLTELTGTRGDEAVSAMRRTLSAEPAQYPDPLLAAYNDHGGSTLTTILVDEPMDKLSAAEQSQLTSLGSARQVVAAIMSGVGVEDPQSEPTDAADGALTCGTKNESGTGVTVCLWYDGTTFGSLQYLDGTSASVAAPVADAVRAAAEG
jgi:hypothetical protein